MNELIQLLVERTGMQEEKAATVAELVIHFLRDRSPPSMASHLDHFLEKDAERRGGWNS